MNPIICAIDTTDVNKSKNLLDSVAPYVGAVKLGLEFFTANGASAVAQVAGNFPLFLDLKFHDIPNTVAGAIRATSGINSFMMTVHGSGGKEMMKSAVKAAQELERKPLIVGVTVLTSLDEEDLKNIGLNYKVSDQVLRLANLAQESGLDGVVCSAHEIEIIRKECGKDFKLVVPGIRTETSQNGDQKRIMTPTEAIKQGANYLVIGRPISCANNPAQAAQEIASSIGQMQT